MLIRQSNLDIKEVNIFYKNNKSLSIQCKVFDIRLNETFDLNLSTECALLTTKISNEEIQQWISLLFTLYRPDFNLNVSNSDICQYAGYYYIKVFEVHKDYKILSTNWN